MQAERKAKKIGQKAHARVCDYAEKAGMEVLEVLAFRLPKAIHKVLDTTEVSKGQNRQRMSPPSIQKEQNAVAATIVKVKIILKKIGFLIKKCYLYAL